MELTCPLVDSGAIKGFLFYLTKTKGKGNHFILVLVVSVNQTLQSVRV